MKDGEERIGMEEIKIIGRMKNGKAAGMNGIPGSVEVCGGEELEGWVGEFCNKVWEGEG